MTMSQRTSALCVLVLAAAATPAAAQSLTCPAQSGNNTFQGGTLQADCVGTVTTDCTSKSGVAYDPVTGNIALPGQAGNFQAPPGAAVNENVYFAAPGDFDKDGWDDFVAANDSDKVYVMRNQTITCGTTGCSGSTSTAPSVQTIPASWWNTITNVRSPAFRPHTTTSGTDQPLKSGVGSTGEMSPMISADFNGDGWPDVAVISATYDPSGGSGGVMRWPTAARLFLNTKNCHDVTNQPCGIGRLCTGQPTNGACSGAGVTGSGTSYSQSNLACTSTTKCPYYFPTFATYDLRTGAAVSSTGTTSSTTPTTSFPSDFGPIGHPVQNMFAMDWDGDGDIDILYGHSTGTCPGSLCTTAGKTFYAGIDVWKNDCAQSAAWSSATKSCPGYIPKFTHSTSGTCNGTSCNNSDVLLPSTAHNNTTLAPNTNLGFDIGGKEVPGFAYLDIDKDGDNDLIIGSPGCCSSSSNAKNRMRIFKGTTNSKTSHMLDTNNPLIMSTSNGTYPGFEGGLTGVFVYDFSGDGYSDIITGSDAFGYSSTIGGRTRYWLNNGISSNPFGTTNWPNCATTASSCTGCSATCNPTPTKKISESCGGSTCATNTAATPPTFPDFDMGLMLDYDHDPTFTKDIVYTNGNTSNEFYVFPNRASLASVAACGTVASGTLPLGSNELTINGACIKPTSTTPTGTSITYYLNNENPGNWQLACTQTPAGYSPALNGSGQCCVTFPNDTGRTVQWKAVIDSNTTDGAGVCTAPGTNGSPSISSVVASYTYSAAQNHYEAGVIVSDGVAYVGSFSQPGNRGHLYATSASLGTTYYDFGTKLDGQGGRSVYTTDVTGASLTRIQFDPAAPSTSLQSRIGASSAAQATTVINWVLSARFGVNAPLTKLGAILDSTPAILNAPFRPNWYTFLTGAERTDYDSFATANATRVPLLLFAAMDGMIHAVITTPTDVSGTNNGTEAWAFVPPFVATNMTADYNASCPGACSPAPVITTYPDGSPTLLDYKKSNGTIATAAIIGDGDGGRSVTALDVTNTVNPATFSTTGPTPMWSWQPGGAAAGHAISKVGVARVKISGTETFVAVTGTGIDSSDNSKGKVVVGYNLETGAELWKFEMQCPLTSDITIFETDDTGEPGPPTVDGFADRAVFADNCGYVYKINPADMTSVVGGYMGNTGYGGIALGASNGVNRFALFSTQSTATALGQQRPIAGVIGARSDATTDMVLFFGTGGIDSYDVTKTNEFYAVYAKNGTIRNKLTGSCKVVSGSTICEKFYGGVVITPDQVILQRTYDPIIGASSCDFGATKIQSYALSNFSTVIFDLSQIAGQALAAVSGPLYGDAGALYFATVSGEVKRVGTPRAPVAGADSTAGTDTGMGATEIVGGNAPFVLMGWRVVL
jgi:hypothetical protein